MKLHKLIFGTLFAAVIMFGSCTDQIQFGNAFISKAPGAGATADTVFNSAEYTTQYLTGIYKMQYYGIPWRSSNSSPLSASYWTGQVESLSDCWQLFFSGSQVYKAYYNDQLTASSTMVYGYGTENVWELVHAAYNLIENVGNVPGLSESEKNHMAAEAKCLIASAYFNLMRFYGGLPIVDHSYAVTESDYNIERSTIAQTVDFIVGLLDEAAPNLEWQMTEDQLQVEEGRWTKAGAMALKCKVLCFAASPIFNDSQPYYEGKYTMERDSLVWYGGYSEDRWVRCRKACDEFFAQLKSNGGYELVQPTSNDQAGYRYAYRYAYINEYSPELLHVTRVTNTTNDSKYSGYNLPNNKNSRYSYCPTQEYVEMFPWSDGKPFDWDESEKAGELDHMFVKGDTVKGKQMLQNRVYTRDPRLYEVMDVNGAEQTADWSSGKMSGANFETWVGGTDAGTGTKTESGVYATSYRLNKYIIGAVYKRKFPQWVVLRLSDIYLIYAEALAQADNNLTEALKYVDAVRARVGLKGLAECNPSLNLTTNKDNLVEEILRERACELGFEDTRFFDMIRYKRSDLFEKKLHGLRIYRLVKDGSSWKREETQWYNADRKNYAKKESSNPERYYEPSHFDYEKYEISVGARGWWNGFDVKWFLHPFPQTEVNKGYLEQNPGW